jgi:hypothetical protein
MDPNVSEDIQMTVFSKGKKCEIINPEEIEDIKIRLAPLSKNSRDTLTRNVENIVKIREELNNLWDRTFGFKLLLQSEKAVFQIMNPCRTESEFANNISALALLIDLFNIKEMNKTIIKGEGSINVLDNFLTDKIKDFPPEIISNLRDIVTLRSKKFPTHVTDPKFVEVVLKITKKFPPNWSDLYLKALDLYIDSLNKLLISLQKAHQN